MGNIYIYLLTNCMLFCDATWWRIAIELWRHRFSNYRHRQRQLQTARGHKQVKIGKSHQFAAILCNGKWFYYHKTVFCLQIIFVAFVALLCRNLDNFSQWNMWKVMGWCRLKGIWTWRHIYLKNFTFAASIIQDNGTLDVF